MNLEIWAATAGFDPEKNRQNIQRPAKCIGTPDGILTVGYDDISSDHGRTSCRMLQISRNENLKFNKDKCHFHYIRVLFCGEIISRQGEKPYPNKLWAITKFTSVYILNIYYVNIKPIISIVHVTHRIHVHSHMNIPSGGHLVYIYVL